MKYRYSQLRRRPRRRDRPRVAGLAALRPAAVERLQQAVGSAERRRPHDAGAARRDSRRAAERRRAVGRDARAAAVGQATTRARSEATARTQLEAARPADHRAAAEQGYISDGRPAGASSGSTARAGPATDATRFEVTDKALDFLGYRALARPARVDRPQQRRPARHARAGHRHRGGRPAAPVRVRRHDEPRRVGDGAECGRSTRTARTASASRSRGEGGDDSRGHRHRLRRPDGHAGRLPELVRDRAAARLQPQHGALRRRPVHAGQARGDGAGESDPPSVSGRRAERGALPRLGGGSAAQPARPGAGRAVLHEHARRSAAGAPACSSASARTCGRSS